MKKLICLIVCLFICIPMAFAQEKNFKLMIVGDSLSASYRMPEEKSFTSQLDQFLRENGYKNISVVSYAKNGETTTSVLKKMNTILDEKPHAVLLALGFNDTLRKVDLPTIQSNLDKIIETFLNADIQVFLIGMRATQSKDTEYQADFAKIYETLARKHALLFYPFFLEGLAPEGEKITRRNAHYFQFDKVHPNEEGVALIIQNIFPKLQIFLKEFQ